MDGKFNWVTADDTEFPSLEGEQTLIAYIVHNPKTHMCDVYKAVDGKWVLTDSFNHSDDEEEDVCTS